MKSFLLALGCALLLAGVASASDYTFANGYYWKGGQAFTRSVVKTYDARGCLINTYQYTPYAAAVSTTTNITNVTHETPNWRSKLLEIAEFQKQSEAKLRASALEHQEYMEALKVLGLKGPTSVYTTSVDAYGYSQVPTAQGSTVYGYSGYNEIADPYGRTDLGEIYNYAMRLAESSNRYGADATNGAFKLVDQLGDRASGLLSQQYAVEEIKAKSNGIISASRALGDVIKAESRFRVEKRVETPAPPQPSGSPVLDEPRAKAAGSSVGEQVTALVHNKCVSCHGGGKTQAGLNLTDLGKLDGVAIEKILDRISTTNPEKRMPPDGKLSNSEISLFYKAASPPAE